MNTKFLKLTAAQASFYQKALEQLGISAAVGEGFRLDAAGWSPEVARALGVDDYLFVGKALQAIIVSPEQGTLPVLRPAHTFDALTVAELFRGAKDQIANVTSRAAIVARIAPDVDVVRHARDLLHVEAASVSARDTEGLMEAVELQRVGAEKIRDEPTGAWKDTRLMQELAESSLRFGDLRTVPIQVQPIHFTDVRCFGARHVAGGGAWVLRDLPRAEGEDIVVVSSAEKGMKPSAHYLPLDVQGVAAEVAERIWRAKLVVVDHARARRDGNASDEVDHLRRCLLLDTLARVSPGEAIGRLDDVRVAALERNLDGAIPEPYWDLGRYLDQVRSGARLPSRRQLDAFVAEKGLVPFLAVPAKGVTRGTSAALLNLLAAIEPRPLRRRHHYAPVDYHEAVRGWPAHFHQWAKEEVSGAVSLTAPE